MSSQRTHFRELNHTADLSVEVWGKDFAELIANAAESLFVLEGLPAEPGEPVRREIRITALDREALLVDWLNEVLLLSEMQGELYTSFDVTLVSDVELSAVVTGQRGRPSKRWLKAATYYGLRIEERPHRCAARIVFDV